MAHDIPRDRSLDSTVALLREGYLFIPHRCRRLRSDIFSARLMGEKAIWLSGADAAALFYDNQRFQRTGAIPRRIRKSLFGEGGVQMLDDEAHRHRKSMFMTIVAPDRVRELAEIAERLWHGAAARWSEAGSVVLFPAAQELLCRAACAWAGVPLAETDVRRRADQFGALVDSFGGVGPRHWRGRVARRSLERWIGGVIEQVRSGALHPSAGAALRVIADHREMNGERLDVHTAAVELINVLRPIVAIATYITFAALALHEHPRCRELLRGGDDGETERFAHEVRRFYPFGPFLGARVRHEFVWRDYTFRKGTLVLLDIYGTDRDPRRWERSDEFLPERFQRDVTPYEFIPQGGGDPHTGHRCAGEGVTVELLKVAVRFLARDLEYDVPAQDLAYDLDRMPTLPHSGFVLTRVRPSARPQAPLEPRPTGERPRPDAPA